MQNSVLTNTDEDQVVPTEKKPNGKRKHHSSPEASYVWRYVGFRQSRCGKNVGRRLHCLVCFKIEEKKGVSINWTKVQSFSTGTSTTSIGTHLVSHGLIKNASRQVNDQMVEKVVAECSSQVINKKLGRQALMILLTLFVVCCNLPFKIVENRHFKRFVNALDLDSKF